MLCYHHGLTDREAKLAGCFLLQGRGGEWGSWCTLHGFLLDALNGKGGFLAFLEEGNHLSLSLETVAKQGLNL